MSFKIKSFLVAVSLVAALFASNAISEEFYKLDKKASGFSVPWGMTFISDTQMLVTERQGKLYRLDLASGKKEPISGLPAIAVMGQGGLLDIQASPNFKSDGWIYFTYSKPVKGDEGATALAKAKLKGNQLDSLQDLIVTKSASDGGRHFGSRITFDNKGHLFFSVGDRGDRDNGQDLMNHASTIVRLKLDGSIPKDNPFVGSKKGLDEIWSYGHRNPQGMFFDKEKGQLWSIEHGPRGGDEINLIKKGANYGWAVISYGKEYWGPVAVGEGTHREGMEQPVKYYVPSIAPSSLIMYRGEAFPQWQGNLFSGALKLTHLNRVVLDSNGKPKEEERLFKSLGERIRNVITDDKGLIYFATDRGNIYQVSPKK